MDLLKQKLLDPDTSIDNKEYWQGHLGIKTKRGVFTDSDDHQSKLQLLKYTRGVSDLTNPFVQICRGIIFGSDSDNSNLRPICWPLRCRLEYDNFKNEVDWKNCRVTEYYDGTLINMFYFGGKWNFSTRGMISAHNSYWRSEKNFQELFLECVGNDFLTTIAPRLNTNNCYSWVIQHPENKIVSSINAPSARLVQIRDCNTGKVCPVPDFLLSFDVEEIHSFSSFNDMESNISERGINRPGVMIWQRESDIRCKFLSQSYNEAAELRGNTPDTWLNILKAQDNKTIDSYLKYFSEDTPHLDNINQITRRFLASVHFLYSRVFVHKIRTNIPPHLRKFVHDIHRLYHERKSKVIDSSQAFISHKVVKGYFHSQAAERRTLLLKNHCKYLEERSAVSKKKSEGVS